MSQHEDPAVHREGGIPTASVVGVEDQVESLSSMTGSPRALGYGNGFTN